MSYEAMPSQQQKDFDRAIALAHRANAAFISRQGLAARLASVYTESAQPAPASTRSAEANFTQANNDFSLYDAAAEALMPPPEAFETKEPSEPFANEAVWSAMGPEQRAKASKLRTALADGPLKEYGVSEESLRVVMAEKDGQRQLVLIHIGSGIDIGNPEKTHDHARTYNGVMSGANDGLFQIQVDGVTHDARSGMTSEVYVAKVADAMGRGVALPDSRRSGSSKDNDWTWTMLTGDPLIDKRFVEIRSVNEKGICRGWNALYGYSGDRSQRVCPAVVIDTIDL